MIELLRRAADNDGDAIGIVSTTSSWSYARLVEGAERFAVGLRAAGIDRFAVVSNEIPLVVCLMAAASLTGAEICVYSPVARPEAVRRQATEFAHQVLVTTRNDLADCAPTVLDARSLATDGEPPTELPAKRPLLVLTTGTTGAPRGVRHDWSRQVDRVLKVRPSPGAIWLLAYGPQQFAGLQVLLHVFATGAALVAPPVRQPQAVVEAVREHGIDHISATPTFWRFLLAELRADDRPLPALRQITLGGEAAPAQLLLELAAAFPGARVSHIYAGSEFGSTGSVRDRRDGLPASLLDGASEHGVSMKIVDGELWVRSAEHMLGYYGEPDLPDGNWWPTGDLVELVDDRIVFRGRQSDVINVGGVKVHPLPVEERVATVAGVRIARVYGRPNSLVGEVVAVDVVPDRGAEAAELEARIRAACADLPRTWQPRSIRIVEDVEMNEGKLVRGIRSS